MIRFGGGVAGGAGRMLSMAEDPSGKAVLFCGLYGLFRDGTLSFRLLMSGRDMDSPAALFQRSRLKNGGVIETLFNPGITAEP